MTSFFNKLKAIPIILAIFSTVYVWIEVDHLSYQIMFLLPLSYICCYVFFLKKYLDKDSTLFYLVFNGVIFFRYVVLPASLVYAAYYEGRSGISPDKDSFVLAFFLMIFELIVATLVASYYEKRTSRNKEHLLHLTLGLGKNIVFTLFVIFSIIYLIYDINWLLVINIFIPNPISKDLPTEALLGSYFLVISKQILFVFTIYFSSIQYKKYKKKIYLIIVFVMLLFNIGIYFGTNRSDVLITSIVSFLMLSKLFPLRIAIRYVWIIIIGVLSLLFVITETRNFVSPTGGRDVAADRADFLQAYLGGPYNVAMAIETKEQFPEANDLEVLFYDIFRPMLGVNYLVKDLNINYSNIYFNQRIFTSANRSQIIPMVGQGYLFFGFIFAPLFSIIFIRLAYYLINIYKKNSNALLFYFFSLSIARLGFFMGQNTMNMINDLSFNLFLFLILFYLNEKVAGRNINITSKAKKNNKFVNRLNSNIVK